MKRVVFLYPFEAGILNNYLREWLRNSVNRYYIHQKNKVDGTTNWEINGIRLNCRKLSDKLIEWSFLEKD